MKIAVGSENPPKLTATRGAFEKVFPGVEFEILGMKSVSGVSDQPMTDDETHQGALNRVSFVEKEVPDADYWVAIEGGAMETRGDLEMFAWVVVKSRSQKIGTGRTAGYFVPPKVVELVRQGIELGTADDMVFNRQDSKRKEGAVGILTGSLVTRASYYEEAVILALIPFKNPELYP